MTAVSFFASLRDVGSDDTPIFPLMILLVIIHEIAFLTERFRGRFCHFVVRFNRDRMNWPRLF